MADYFDRVKNEGYVDGKLTRDYNEYLQMGGWDMDKPGSNSSTSYQGKQDAINKRYDALIQSIKSRGQTAVTNQTNITSGELGKRGILSSSTLAGQEMQNAVQPVTQQYTGLEAGAEADRSTAIAEAIAQQQQMDLARQQQQAGANQQGIDNALKQGALANDTARTQYDTNRPYSTASGSGVDPVMEAALKAIGGSLGGATNPTKPTASFKPVAQPKYGPLKSGYKL